MRGFFVYWGIGMDPTSAFINGQRRRESLSVSGVWTPPAKRLPPRLIGYANGPPINSPGVARSAFYGRRMRFVAANLG